MKMSKSQKFGITYEAFKEVGLVNLSSEYNLVNLFIRYFNFILMEIYIVIYFFY